MKNLLTYLQEELATPANTIGMGNPGIHTDPLVAKPLKEKKRKKTSADFIYRGQA